MSHTRCVLFFSIYCRGSSEDYSRCRCRDGKIDDSILDYLWDCPSLHISVYCICSVITLEVSRIPCTHPSFSGAVRIIRFLVFFCRFFVVVEQMISIISLSIYNNRNAHQDGLLMAGTRQSPFEKCRRLFSSICWTSGLWSYFPK